MSSLYDYRSGKNRLFEPISRRTYFKLAAGSLCACVAFWSVLSHTGIIDDLILPTPGQVWAAFIDGLGDGTLLADVQASVARISTGFLISSLLALPIGILMGCYKIVEAALEPIVDLIRYMPAVAFIPLTLIWFGTTELQKIAILFIGVFFQQVLLIVDNVKTVPRNLVDMARTLGFGSPAILVRVVTRAALPGIVDSLRISLGWAWTYLVVAELIGADEGLGFRIQQAQRFVETPKIIFGIIVIGALGLAFDLAFKKFHARSFPYLVSKRWEA